MLISTIPPKSLVEICNQWKQGDGLQELVGGQLFSAVESIGFDDPDDIYLSTSTSIVLEDCALMLWIQQQTEEPITVGCQWAGDYQCGALALAKGAFKEFTVSTEALMDLQKALLLENTDTSEIDELREQGNSEEEIDEILWEWSDDYRVEARDGLQTAFLRSIHDGNSNLTDYAYFKMLSDLGCEWQINDLPDMAKSAAQLLKPIDYNDPEYINSIFGQQSDEFWKLHRDRIHGILKNLPEELKDRKDLFKQIIPKVAAWVLDYAGPEVRSDKDILRLAIEADKTHGYAPSALEYATAEVFEDREFLEEVLTQQKDEFYNLPEALQKDRELLKIVLKQGLSLPEEVSTDRELVETFMSSGDRFAYNSIPEDVTSDPELAKIYLRHGGCWSSIPEKLRKRWDLMAVFIEHYDYEQDYISVDYELADHLGLETSGLTRKIKLPLNFILKSLEVNSQFARAIEVYWINSEEELLTLFTDHDLVSYELSNSLVLGSVMLFAESECSSSAWYHEIFRRALALVPLSERMQELERDMIVNLMKGVEGDENTDKLKKVVSRSIRLMAVGAYWKAYYGEGPILDRY
ncbi:hypothetical protein OAQ35_03020 [Litorivicinus sp.]|nr:hypothetical protein [Litorivicinus sp.]